MAQLANPTYLRDLIKDNYTGPAEERVLGTPSWYEARVRAILKDIAKRRPDLEDVVRSVLGCDPSADL